MNRISERFDTLRSQGETALITYLTAGDPTLADTPDLVLAMEEGGADLIELGVPFSDPMADGPVIQAASQRALKAGANVRAILDIVYRLRTRTEIPIILMSYFNPLLQYGLRAFTGDAARAGVDGVIVPDLPLEESGILRELADANGIALIPLVAPTSPPDRIGAIAREARGFIYCVTVKGITGPRAEMPANLQYLTSMVRRSTDLPVALGFGVSGPRQAAQLRDLADGVVVGSALVKFVAEKGMENIKQFITFVKELKNALGKG
ncbi:MAG: tryptophan synthase subunit alpha [Peptococcaceae bacterium]|nr:tryptophan synthase subunit alpha [Peptococcaceae bacterium]